MVSNENAYTNNIAQTKQLISKILHVYTYTYIYMQKQLKKKRDPDLEESQKGNVEGLVGGKGRCGWSYYIIVSKVI